MYKRLLFFLLLLPFCASAQQINYVVKNNAWDLDSLGTHRVVLTVADPSKPVAKALIAWRRNDTHPENKDIIIVDSASNQRIHNVLADTINREAGLIYFQPQAGHSVYYVYYLPYKIDRKSNYPNAKYLKPEKTLTAEWQQLTRDAANVSKATVLQIEEVNAMNSFYPMEVIATQAEVTDLIHKNAGKSYLV